MAAAVIVASHAKADALGVPAERRVYLRGWCYADRPRLRGRAPRPVGARRRWRAAGREALARRGRRHRRRRPPRPLHLLRQLGAPRLRRPRPRPARRPRPHRHRRPAVRRRRRAATTCCTRIATMVDVLRADPGSLGLVTGVGMHMTKHAFGLYSTAPAAAGPRPPARRRGVQARLDAAATDRHRRPARRPGHGRHLHRRPRPRRRARVGPRHRRRRRRRAAPTAGSRTPTCCSAMEAEEWVGRPITLRARDDGVNLVRQA